MHSLISDTAGIWRHRLFAVCIGASLWVAILLAGCSNSSNSTAMQRGSAPTDSLVADQQVYKTLANSCFDCHADRGSGSWNARLAPSYLFGANKGREVLNFSNWATLDVKQRNAMASKIEAVVDSESMPPADYDFFHPSAKLSDAQKKLVLQWSSQQIALPAH
ncbi:MAG: heme-binding domain-containing protein [Candidatus Binataceae bacterium]